MLIETIGGWRMKYKAELDDWEKLMVLNCAMMIDEVSFQRMNQRRWQRKKKMKREKC